ncbi:helix-turn-helix domain-containing protein [Okeanomitos corallinicola TIOX110]|uniref:Helix-turn-helix domain-containing protein n=1 Tax=Okeanomitos corallinicola TIOX110 TaxID=3133117 RepID=A0ABZ2UV22_9CYAN
MTMVSAYSFSIPGNSTIQISKDELRSLLREIESELHRSKVYRLAVANVQKLLGSSEEQAKNLFKAVGREAITLAFQQFVQKNQADTVTETPVLENNTELLNLHEEKLNDLSVNSTNQESNSQPEVANTTQITEQTTETKTPIKWLWQNQKLSKRQISTQILAEQRLESLRQIGEQLRQAREAQGLTLQKLNIYTHISVHQMEAVENANFDLLPEDILIRGFIRIMANALGLNGTILANSLPVSNQSKSVIPSWDQNKKSSGQLNLEISPAHLYIGYTALVAGAVGGLSLISQQANYPAMHNSQVILPTSSSLCESTQKTEANTQTEINSRKTSVCLGSNISPPEAL